MNDDRAHPFCQCDAARHDRESVGESCCRWWWLRGKMRGGLFVTIWPRLPLFQPQPRTQLASNVIMTGSPTIKKRTSGIVALELAFRLPYGLNEAKGVELSSRRPSSRYTGRAIITIPAYLYDVSLQAPRDVREMSGTSQAIIEPIIATIEFDFNRTTIIEEIPILDLGRERIDELVDLPVKSFRGAARTRKKSLRWHPYAPQFRAVLDADRESDVSTLAPPTPGISRLHPSSPSRLGCRRCVRLQGVSSHGREQVKRHPQATGLVGECQCSFTRCDANSSQTWQWKC